MRRPILRTVGARAARLGGFVTILLATASCGKGIREGEGAGFVVIDLLVAASGRQATFTGTLQSDVITNVTITVLGVAQVVPTVFEDSGRVLMRFIPRDPGTEGNPTLPTELTDVTINRYRVVYRRADGRNTPGVDVPYPFDGAATGTVGFNNLELTFTIVRAQAKLEPPLRALAGSGGANVISTIAEVTFWGQDRYGHNYRVVGNIGINFSDWGDPT